MTVTTENATQSPVVEASFEHGLEQTVLPGRGLTLCAPSRRDLYQNRLADASGDVAEMFQINARWRRGAFEELPNVEEQKALRRWFLNAGRVFDFVDSGPSPMLPLAQVQAPLGPALAAMARAGAESGLLFAADILVIADGWSYLLPAGQEHLVRLRTFTQQQRRDLVAAVSHDVRQAFDEASCHLAVVVSPQRVQVTHGPRGYRNALMEWDAHRQHRLPHGRPWAPAHRGCGLYRHRCRPDSGSGRSREVRSRSGLPESGQPEGGRIP